jgi:hypothetical protein
MDAAAPTAELRSEYEPRIAAELTATFSPGRVMSAHALEDRVIGPLGELERSVDSEILRAALDETIARGVIRSAGAHWPSYTRRVADFLAAHAK